MLKFITYVALAALAITSSVHAETKHNTVLPNTATGPAPLWVDDPSVQFSRIDYLTRRGRADNAQSAADEAQNKLIQLLRYDENTLIDDALLASIGIKGVWHNSEKNNYRAIAIMPRKEAEQLLRQTIITLDDNTTTAIKARADDSTTITQLRLTAQALQYQKERSFYQASMKKVDVTGRGIAPNWDVKKLDKELDTLVTGLSITAKGDVSDISIDRMKKMLERGFKVAGVTVHTTTDTDYTLTGCLTISHKPDPSGWMLGMGVLEVDLYDKTSAKTIGKYQWNIEVTHLYPETAERRVIERAEYLLKKEMHNVLIAIALQ